MRKGITLPAAAPLRQSQTRLPISCGTFVAGDVLRYVCVGR